MVGLGVKWSRGSLGQFNKLKEVHFRSILSRALSKNISRLHLEYFVVVVVAFRRWRLLALPLALPIKGHYAIEH